MRIKKIVVGSLQENCYILINKNDCLIIDPGDEFNKILKEIENYNLVGILITHYHFDHVGALDELLEYKNVPIYNSKMEEKEYKINDFNFEIIKTFGHTNDSVTYYFKEENIMFVGDFIFRETIGRTDLPTGNILCLWECINKIKKYNKDRILYPGHGEETTIKHEIEYNYYFNQ